MTTPLVIHVPPAIPDTALYQPARWGGRPVGLFCLLEPIETPAPFGGLHAVCAFPGCACQWDGHGIVGHDV